MYYYFCLALPLKYHEYIQRSEFSLDDHIPLHLHQSLYFDIHLMKMLRKKKIRFRIIFYWLF